MAGINSGSAFLSACQKLKGVVGSGLSDAGAHSMVQREFPHGPFDAPRRRSIGPHLSCHAAATFAASFLGRAHTRRLNSDALADQKLSKWLVGLSAGATGNSAFIVTGVVGLGYTLGLQALLLPFGWLFGDIAFWIFFPDRINRLGRETKAATLTDVLSAACPPPPGAA